MSRPHRIRHLVLAVVACGAFASAASAADPFAGYGKPSGYHYRTVQGQKMVCEYWAWGSRHRISALVERCVPVPAKRKKTGPSA